MKNELIIKNCSSSSSMMKLQIQAAQRFLLTQVMLALKITDTNCDEVAEKGNSHLLLVLMYTDTILLEFIVGNPQNTKSKHITAQWYLSLFGKSPKYSNSCPSDTCSPLLIAVLFSVAKE